MKFEDEITVEVSCDLNKLKDLLYSNNFKVVQEYDIDDIYMLNKSEDKTSNLLELLKNCVLIRNIVYKFATFKFITYKYKDYNDKNEIIKQGKINCAINNVNDAKELLVALNYEYLLNIYDHIIVFSNGVDELAVQLLNDKHIYIEIESECKYTDKKYSSCAEMKSVISKYNIPIKSDDYFVKKAEIELKEIMEERSK